MNARPQAWLNQAQNDLELAGLATQQGFDAQACFFASQAADETPPSERFDRQDAAESIACAAAVLEEVRRWDAA